MREECKTIVNIGWKLLNTPYIMWDTDDMTRLYEVINTCVLNEITLEPEVMNVLSYLMMKDSSMNFFKTCDLSYNIQILMSRNVIPFYKKYNETYGLEGIA